MRKAHKKPLPRVAEDSPGAAPLAPIAAAFMPAPAPSLPTVIAPDPDTLPDIAASHLVDANGFDPAQ
jgi:hypothetical protein